jgi:hypothetical protein
VGLVKTAYDAAVTAVEAYETTAAAALSGDAAEDSTLVMARTDANAALAALKAPGGSGRTGDRLDQQDL